MDALSDKARAKCLAYLRQVEEHGFGLPHSVIAKVRGKIWELRPEWGGIEYRFFYVAIVGRRIVALHAIRKQSQKLKAKDIEMAESRYHDVLKRLVDEATPPIRRRTDQKES
ncbi:MAG: type II toxin-antitoxin system RelE/ParE family toxin [Nitrospira sp.]|nr:MAG: type II toxin-antitoxin system RelE/ParE family toxin [Nitrospira sp.]